MTRLKNRILPQKEILLTHGLTLTDIATRLNVSYPYALNVLNGIYGISAIMKGRIDALVKQVEAGEV